MDVLRTPREMTSWSRRVRSQGWSLGLTPTMGFFHAGHLSLVQRSLAVCDRSVVSLFVNPKQFGPGEDLDTYPVDLDRDLKLLADLRVDAAFVPSVESMYPPGYSTYVEVEGLSAHLCGAQRPGFFRGVSTVVLKLLNIVQPHTAFFGEKDRQQLAVVRRMVEDLHLDVTIEGAPIVREADGLALSSRNSYLDDGQRRSACVLHQALETARALVARGETRAEVLRRSMREHIQRQAHTKIDYVSVCDPERFTELDTIQGQALVALAVHVGKARLIDNCLVETEGCNESC